MDLVLVKVLNWEQWQHTNFPYHQGSFEKAAPLHQNLHLGREKQVQEVAVTKACRESSSSRQRCRARVTAWWPQVSLASSSSFSPPIAPLMMPYHLLKEFHPFHLPIPRLPFLPAGRQEQPRERCLQCPPKQTHTVIRALEGSSCFLQVMHPCSDPLGTHCLHSYPRQVLRALSVLLTFRCPDKISIS